MDSPYEMLFQQESSAQLIAKTTPFPAAPSANRFWANPKPAMRIEFSKPCETSIPMAFFTAARLKTLGSGGGEVKSTVAADLRGWEAGKQIPSFL
jgi:hypothetical protein